MRQAVAHGVLRDVLEVQIKRRVDIDRLSRRRREAGIVFGERLADVIDEVRRLGLESPLHDEQRLVRGAIGCVGRDMAEIRHRVQDDVAALAAAGGVGERRERRRRLDDAGDRRRFRERQVTEVLAEEEPRCLGHADDRERTPLPERHVVEIHLEDVVLRRPAREDDGDPCLEQLAPDRFFAGRLQRHAGEFRQEHVAHQLLRDRAAAGHVRPGAADVRQERADDADGIDAGIVVEPVILDREDRLDHAGRNHRQRHRAALLAFAADQRGQDGRVERQAFARSPRRARALDAIRRPRGVGRRFFGGGAGRPASGTRRGPSVP